ncbi:DUF4115 domain-containing protein [Novosphingobium sp. KCTC 2891]|uniref:helix-turn-helix domain-containing protein n=1 Tax=Novosphingobium sp. KCTC 2891 TaxID=2989730 RepID=UPI002223CBD7|nr:helix-turn-helix domain-containing protein [Novosphingobium sp. KCTC 2891]MCW1382298.1 DUF4115 domain-containing protein [Novosphingobium sp. KCTC 2891]
MAQADGKESNANEGGTVVPGPFASVGSRLRAAREAQGRSVKDLAHATRITARHIEAIENGDYAVLPGRPYALGFARSYARAVGLDDKEIVEAVRRELEVRAPRPEPRVIHQFEVGDPAKTPSRLVSWLALLLVGAIVVMGLVFWRSYYWPAAELPPLVGAEASASAAGAAVALAPAPVAAPATSPVIFTALEDGVWVKFSDATGKQLLQRQLAKGESWTLPADVQGPVLWTGRPDALAITVGGRGVPRLAEKEGIVKNVPVDGASLLARPAPAAAPVASPAAPAAAAPAPQSSTVAG